MLVLKLDLTSLFFKVLTFKFKTWDLTWKLIQLFISFVLVKLNYWLLRLVWYMRLFIKQLSLNWLHKIPVTCLNLWVSFSDKLINFLHKSKAVILRCFIVSHLIVKVLKLLPSSYTLLLLASTDNKCFRWFDWFLLITGIIVRLNTNGEEIIRNVRR